MITTILFFNGDAILNWLLSGSGPLTLTVVCMWATWWVRGLISDNSKNVEKVEVKNSDLSQQITGVSDRVTTLDGRVTKVEERVNVIDKQIIELKGDVLKVNDRVTNLEKTMSYRFDQIDVKFEQIDRRFDQVDRRFEQLEAKMDSKFDQIITLLLPMKKSQE